MVVLHVTPCLAPAWACGEVAEHVARLAVAQAAAGDIVIVLTTDVSAPHERIAADAELLDGVHVIRIRTMNSSSRWSVGFTLPRGFGRAADDVLRRFAVEVVHLHEVRTIENLSAAARAGDRTIVLSPHDALRPSRSNGVLTRAWDRFAGPRVLARVRHVIADRQVDVEAAAELWRNAGQVLDAGRVSLAPPPEGAASRPDLAGWTAYARHVRGLYMRAGERGRADAR